MENKVVLACVGMEGGVASDLYLPPFQAEFQQDFVADLLHLLRKTLVEYDVMSFSLFFSTLSSFSFFAIPKL